MMTAKQIQKRVKEKVEAIREHLEFKNLATAEEIAAYWPGGEENRDLTVMGWIFCCCNYTRFLGRMPDHDAPADPAADREVLAALSNTPETVELEGAEDAPKVIVSVYPKSFVALERVDLHDRAIGWLIEQRKKLLSLSLDVSGAALEAIGAEITRQYAMIAWIVTHPQAGLPFALNEVPENLPDWIQHVTTTDLIRIHAAFVKVNLLRLHALYALLDVNTGGNSARPEWRSFFAMRSEDLHVPTETLMLDRSVGSQVATALIASDVRKKALEESRRKSE